MDYIEIEANSIMVARENQACYFCLLSLLMLVNLVAGTRDLNN